MLGQLMPACKLSETLRRLYGGPKGKQLLLDSINFLFAIKGKDFCKQNPSFTIPEASEFIAYSHIVNRSIVGNRKQKETHKSLEQFLRYICGPEIQGPAILRCMFVVLLALAGYSITEFILMGREDVSTLYLSALEWYTSQVVTCLQSSRTTLIETAGQFMETCYISQLPTLIKNFTGADDVSAAAIGSYVIFELQNVVNFRIFDYTVCMPYAASLYKKGYKAACRDIIGVKLLAAEVCSQNSL